LPLPEKIQDKGDMPLHGAAGRLGVMVFANEFLKREYQKAMKAERTYDCRKG
jgi:hypothetical protein